MRARFRVVVAASVMLLAAVIASAPFVGSAKVQYARAFSGQSPDAEIFFYARLPRVILAALAGGSLAVAGVLFQALLRDALATPFTLGISSGGALGAVAAISFGWQRAGFPVIWLASLTGAAATMLLVMWLASEGRRMSSFTLLLSGVTINSICLAMILFLQSIAGFGQSFAIVRWLVGGIDAVEYSSLAWLVTGVLPPLIYASIRARDWNLLAVGEDWAAARGVAVSRLVFSGYVIGSLVTGSVTSLTGPIGFIGLIVPHALRARLGADHRLLVPCSFFCGAAFLVVCDTIGRVILAPTEVPVGVITALLGGPFFISLL
ncbi:MAG: iron ABC transporter permease, partial [Acidobacteria bacterium]|nr:iron ABC transporter permease [Acidobacteriota bacterium]